MHWVVPIRARTNNLIKKPGGLLAFIGLITLLPLFFIALRIFIEQPVFSIRRLEGSKTLIIYPKPYFDTGPSVNFQIRNWFSLKNDGCVLTWENLGGAKFDILFSDSKDTFGLIDIPHWSYAPILMCDLLSNNCWPCDSDDTEREIMFNSLKAHNPELQRGRYWDN